jgi:stearoyl-CoA desaturase (Delta-9 desaturase)
MTGQRRWNPLNTPFLLGTLALALVLVPLQVWQTRHLVLELAVTTIMVCLVGLSITAGYHRLFAHRTYRATWPVRLLMLSFGAAAFENSALAWASDHRLHHRYVDTDKDPYSIRRGFWYAHWIWVMESSNHPLEGVSDLLADPLVMWQHRCYFRLGAAVALLPVLLGLVVGDVWGMVVMGLLLRIVLTHHSTFLINSAAHVFGTQPYSDKTSARDNALLAPLTFGEGFHNFHHQWPGDYRNGIHWYQWDLAKWLLNGLAWVGLVGALRRVPDTVIQRARIAMEEKVLAARLARAPQNLADDLRARLATARQHVDQALASMQAQRESLRTHSADWRASRLMTLAEARIAWAEWRAARFLVRRLA